MWIRSVALTALVVGGGCATQPDVSELISQPVVATQFNASIDFGAFDTFAVDPTVSLVTDVGDAGTIPPAQAQAVVDRITANMTARGYQSVPTSARPSLGLQATAFIQVNVASVSSGYWWGAPGFGATPAYWGYPGSSYYSSWAYGTTAYKSGTLIIECVDLRDAMAGAIPDAAITRADAGTDGAAGGRLQIIWAAYAHAVEQELLSSFAPDVPTAIDQAFAQSPYLTRTGTAAP
jgi:hypothetical protein